MPPDRAQDAAKGTMDTQKTRRAAKLRTVARGPRRRDFANDSQKGTCFKALIIWTDCAMVMDGWRAVKLGHVAWDRPYRPF